MRISVNLAIETENKMESNESGLNGMTCPMCGQSCPGWVFLCPGRYQALHFLGNESTKPFPEEILYHYTTVDTLEKILENKTLRGSLYSQLNDWLELQIGIENIRDNLFSLYNTEKIDEITYGKYQEALNNIESKKVMCFVTSFSRKSNLLSQWRAYTDPHNGGVAIGFYGSKLYNLHKHDKCSLLPCSYTNENGKIKFLEQLNCIFKSGNCSGRLVKTEGGLLINNEIDKLLQVATTIKHYAYYEEQEWRLVTIENDVNKIIEDKGKKFIKYDIDKDMIHEVIISPHGDTEEIEKKIIQLKSEGKLAANLKVEKSSIPFRYVK